MSHYRLSSTFPIYKKVEIKTLSVELSDLLSEQTDSFNLQVNQLKIDEIKLTLNNNIKPISFRDVRFDQNLGFSLSAKLFSQPFAVTATPISEQQYQITTESTFGAASYLLKQKDTTWVLSYKDASLLTYDTHTQSFNISAYNETKQFDIDLNASGHLNQTDWLVELRKFRTQAPFSLEATAYINTQDQHYQINLLHHNDSIELTTTAEHEVLIAGKIEKMQSYSPIASGELNFIGLYTNEKEIYISARSPKIQLPGVTLVDLDLTYIPSRESPLKIFIGSAYNPGFSIEQLALTSAVQDNQITMINLLGVINNEVQSAQMLADITNDQILLTLENLHLRNAFGLWESKQSSSLKLTAQLIELNSLVLANQESEFCIQGSYDLATNLWHAQLESNNLETGFSTKGLLPYETDIIIDHATIKMDLTLQGKHSNILNTNGYIHLQNLNAIIANIAPDFIFPLDYQVDDGQIDIQLANSKYQISGQLHSTQGDIKISTQDDCFYLESPELSFTYGDNVVTSLIELKLAKQHIDINTQISKLHYFPDSITTYASLLNNLEIIQGSMPKQRPQNMSTSISINAVDCDTNFFGITGKAYASLAVNSVTGSPERVEGSLYVEEPKLNILNREINLDHFSINYHNQSWLDGDLNLDLTNSATFSQGTSQATKNEIFIHVGGRLSDPSTEIGSSPNSYPTIVILTELLKQSPLLPAGNENLALIEYLRP